MGQSDLINMHEIQFQMLLLLLICNMYGGLHIGKNLCLWELIIFFVENVNMQSHKRDFIGTA